MFGYMKIYKEELKVKDYRKYQAYYCGLCKRLKEKYGFLGQITLTYDMTFLIILLTSLYEYKSKYMEKTCAIHPVKKHPFLWNEATDYGADMNIALCYFHMMDKWEDEKKTSSYLLMGALRKSYKEVGKKYKRQYRVMKGCLNKLRQCEKREEKRIDLAARYFGQLLGELFVYEEDVWEKTLRRMGFYLGKFIYILDAYDDLEKDIINGNYNPLKYYYEQEDYEKRCKEMLCFVMAECTNAFECLPCLKDKDILRNILYAGVFTKYNEKQKRKRGIKL